MALFKAFRGSRASLDAVGKHDGYAYFCTDDGSFHIDFVDSDGNLQRKQISAGEAEKLTGYSIATSLLYASDTRIPTAKAVQNSLNTLQRKIVHANWATNDSSKRPYVKNRTHWIEYEKGEELISFSFEAETTYVNGYRAMTFTEETEAALTTLKTLLVEGTMYIVVHNNIQYECVVGHGFMSDEIFLGNMWLKSSSNEDTEEQFLIRPNDSGYSRLASIGAGTQSITIYAANEIVHPLDEKFLPETAVMQEDISGFAPIDSPEFLNSISLGRAEDSTVGASSVALGSNVEASGYNAVAIGSGAVASGPFAVAIGNGTTASQYCAYAEGDHSVASGAMSHAENGATAKGTSSHAEGCSTTEGSYAHAEGYQTQAIGSISHTEGWQTEAYGGNSHAEGSLTVAQGGNSHAEGYGTITQVMAQHVQGKYNTKEVFSESLTTGSGSFGFSTYYVADSYTFDESTGNFTLVDATLVSVLCNSTDKKYFSEGAQVNTKIYSFIEITSNESNTVAGSYECIQSVISNDYAHVLGNGTDDENRSNAHTIDWNGNAWFQGDVYVGGASQSDAAAERLAKISEIPEGFSGSWNDLTDKPFGEIEVEGEVLLPETTFSGTYTTYDYYSAGNAIYLGDYSKQQAIVVEFDGALYTTTRWSYYTGGSDIYGIGDVDLDPTYGDYFSSDIDLPFAAIQESVSRDTMRISTADDGEHTIKIYLLATTVKTIDEQYIPDTIARVSEIAEHIDNASNPHNVTAEQIGIYIGPDEPTDPNIKVWINTAEEGTGVIPVLPRITTISLLADNWAGSSEPYSQVVEVNTVTSATKIDLQPTALQVVELQNAETSLMVENNGGVVTCYAIGNKPTVDYTMQVLLQEVSYV